jgi:outer membrane protein
MKITALSLALIAMTASSGIMAQKVGTISLEVSATQISPQVSSGDLSPPAFPNTKVDVSNASGLTGAINYMATDNLAINIPLGLGFKHDVTGAARAQGFGKLAEVRALPITVLAQYRFGAPDSTVRPYVGAGMAFVKFYKEKGTAALTALTNPGSTPTTLAVESKFAPTLQLGAIFKVNEKWYVNAHYAKLFVTADTTFSTRQTLSVKLNPNAFSIAVGYHF